MKTNNKKLHQVLMKMGERVAILAFKKDENHLWDEKWSCINSVKSHGEFIPLWGSHSDYSEMTRIKVGTVDILIMHSLWTDPEAMHYENINCST